MIPEAHLQAALRALGRRGQTILCPISGDCMAPLVRDGDAVRILCGNKDIHDGDMVVFGSTGNWSVQRVVGASSTKGGDHFTVQGDQGGYIYAPVPREDILGKVIQVQGANGPMRLTSGLWRGVNRLLWLRSYVSVRRHRSTSAFWKATNILFLLRARFLPRQWSISLWPIRALCGLNRVWVRTVGKHVGRKAEG